jgi:hypothetical protein
MELSLILADGAPPRAAEWWEGIAAMIVGVGPVAVLAVLVVGVRRLLGME